MRHFTYEGKYESYEDCYFQVSRYADNNNLAVRIMSETEGTIAMVTVNTQITLDDDFITVKDYSENEGMVNWLQSLDVITYEPTSVILSGYVEIPIYKLTEHGKELLGLG